MPPAADSPEWAFPLCPAPPAWELDWGAPLARFAWLGALAGTPQDPEHHAEGDVLAHTRMVAEALVGLEAWRSLAPESRSALFAAALLHDVAKPRCTVVDAAGRVSSPRHAQRGESIARALLWRDAPDYGSPPFAQRERVARLVRLHGLPLWFIDGDAPERRLVAASLSIGLDTLALLAEADVRGRICADQGELLGRVDLLRQLASELGCLTEPYRFASDHSRFVYFRSPQASLGYEAYDDTRFEVTLMCGLPAAGKDTWLRRAAPHLPVISLDAIRDELGAAPSGGQGAVVHRARERARELLRRGEPFAWNATNLTRQLRRRLIDLFAGYGARVRIVCLHAPFATLLRRNRARSRPVPEPAIARMLESFEPPDLTEAHAVEHIDTA